GRRAADADPLELRLRAHSQQPRASAPRPADRRHHPLPGGRVHPGAAHRPARNPARRPHRRRRGVL
ncbi:MAG: hypothetical protein AVDCRST_MAG68-1317, partial [uncultured Gemmatimonadetes bacterium]